MNAVGIICEYNPFHLGHARMLEGLRRQYDAPLVCAMSGNFVQRGDAAVAHKHARAEMAVRCGADLVLELPTPWAMASAERFADGGVELLKVGTFFFSRTGKPYVSMRGVDQNGIYFYDFYLKIPDYRVPKDCQLVDPVWTTLFDVFACVLAGDEEEVYWCCGRLADRSIVVMDGNGNYYHVEKGKEKRYIACNTPRPGEEDFHTVMERLKEEAGRRAGIAQRKQLQEEEQKRLKRLEEIRDALPFRMGMKWGLKLGERIIVPPKYRKILPPVGYYCAYEENACQWGIMALDGKVVVEARYQKVDIECNGTVHLTVIPGKVKTIKL